MSFFFGEIGTDTVKTSSARKAIPINTARSLGCKVCPLNESKSSSKKIKEGGVSNPRLYVLGDFPREVDDDTGIAFKDPRWELIKNEFPLNLKSSIRYNYIVKTKTPDCRSPEQIEIECCREYVYNDILQSKPELILISGALVLSWILPESNGAIDKWRGRFFPIKIQNEKGESHKCLAYAILDINSVVFKRKFNKKTNKKDLETEFDVLFRHDMEVVVDALLKNKLPDLHVIEKNLKDGIVYTEGLKSDRELKKIFLWLDEMQQLPLIAIDIETQGLRPYNKSSKLLTIAVGTSDKIYAFPFNHPKAWTQEQQALLKQRFGEFLIKSGVKVAHNLPFEQEWFAKEYDIKTILKGKWACSYAQAYTIDERRGMHSLGTLTRLYFGFNLKDLTQGLDKNNMISMPLNKVLPYNGLDVKWTHALYQKQQEILLKDLQLKIVAESLYEASPALVAAQNEGLVVDEEQRLKFSKEFEQELAEIERKIFLLPEIEQFYKNLHRRFNPTAPADLLVVLKDILNFDSELRDEKGNLSTQESVLSTLDNCEIAALILEHRGISKKKGTYIDSLPELIHDATGRLHTRFNLYETSTGRLSSEDPNIQNWPNRKGKNIRKIIVPPKGYFIVSADYGQIEARILGVASQDEVFCRYLWEDYDVHMAWAEKIAEKYPDVIGGSEFLQQQAPMKKFRSLVKNQWVFPAFYGASPFSIAKSMNIPIAIVQELFKEFWDTFKGIKKWQQWMVNFYNKNNYVETLTGRRRHGPLSYNKLINAPIQGTASDICVNAMKQLVRKNIKVVMNVHDDVTSYVKEDELEEQVLIIAETMCDVPYRWINVPIAVELSCGQDWYSQEDLGTFKSTDFKEVSSRLYEVGAYARMI